MLILIGRARHYLRVQSDPIRTIDPVRFTAQELMRLAALRNGRVRRSLVRYPDYDPFFATDPAPEIDIPPEPYVDPLSALDDPFSGDLLLPKWGIIKPAATPGITVGGGYARIPIVGGGSGIDRTFWFNGFDGLLLNQECSTSFDARVYAEARNAADTSAAPTEDFKIIGLSALDISGPPYNYVHVGFGSNGTGSLQAEHKSTEDSVSHFDYIPNPSGAGWLRLLRIGQIFSTFFGPSQDGPWTLINTVNRNVAAPAMPSTVALGLMTYSNVNGPSDILGRFRDFTVRTPS